MLNLQAAVMLQEVLRVTSVMCYKQCYIFCHMAGSDGEILQLCRDCLAKVKDILSPFSVYMLRVLDHAFDAAVSSALWEEALGYGIQTLEPYRLVLCVSGPMECSL